MEGRTGAKWSDQAAETKAAEAVSSEEAEQVKLVADRAWQPQCGLNILMAKLMAFLCLQTCQCDFAAFSIWRWSLYPHPLNLGLPGACFGQYKVGEIIRCQHLCLESLGGLPFLYSH